MRHEHRAPADALRGVHTTIETFVLDFSSNVYGEKVRLFFLDRLREERKFPSVTDLSAQIRRDIEDTREYFAGARKGPAGE